MKQAHSFHTTHCSFLRERSSCENAHTCRRGDLTNMGHGMRARGATVHASGGGYSVHGFAVGMLVGAATALYLTSHSLSHSHSHPALRPECRPDTDTDPVFIESTARRCEVNLAIEQSKRAVLQTNVGLLEQQLEILHRDKTCDRACRREVRSSLSCNIEQTVWIDFLIGRAPREMALWCGRTQRFRSHSGNTTRHKRARERCVIEFPHHGNTRLVPGFHKELVHFLRG